MDKIKIKGEAKFKKFVLEIIERCFLIYGNEKNITTEDFDAAKRDLKNDKHFLLQVSVEEFLTNEEIMLALVAYLEVYHKNTYILFDFYYENTDIRLKRMEVSN